MPLCWWHRQVISHIGFTHVSEFFVKVINMCTSCSSEWEKYKHVLSSEDNNKSVSLQRHRDTKDFLQNNLIYINLVPCELDLSGKHFIYSTIAQCYLEISPQGKKIGLNIMDDDGSTIPYILVTIKNYPAGHQFQPQLKNNVWIMESEKEYSLMLKVCLQEYNKSNTLKENQR